MPAPYVPPCCHWTGSEALHDRVFTRVLHAMTELKNEWTKKDVCGRLRKELHVMHLSVWSFVVFDVSCHNSLTGSDNETVTLMLSIFPCETSAKINKFSWRILPCYCVQPIFCLLYSNNNIWHQAACNTCLTMLLSSSKATHVQPKWLLHNRRWRCCNKIILQKSLFHPHWKKLFDYVYYPPVLPVQPITNTFSCSRTVV